MNEWISVNEKLPEEHVWILLGSIDYYISTWGIYIDGKFYNPDKSYYNEIPYITHWMPLPESPKYACKAALHSIEDCEYK